MKKLKKGVLLCLLLGFMGVIFLPGKIYAGQAGTPIYDVEDLLKMEKSTGSFYLANDIDMLDYGLWKPISFSGKLDGNGYTISNLRVSGEEGGLFSEVDNATIKNIKFNNVEKKGQYYDYYNNVSGGIVQSAYDSTLINLSINGEINIYGQGGCVGGIVGRLRGKSSLKNSCNNMNIYVSGARVVAGLVGCADSGSSVINCYNTGDIISTSDAVVRGLVGEESGKLYYCYNIGKLSNEGETESSGIATFCETGVGQNCYCLSSASDYAYSWYPNSSIVSGCKKITEVEMKSKSSYTGWDFDDVWTIDSSKNNGYPILITEKTGAPTTNYAAGRYENEIYVALQSSTANATIYYTLDGSVPTKKSYIYYSPIQISKTTNLRAIAIADGYKISDEAVFKYVFEMNAPRINLRSGKYGSNIEVKMSCNTTGAKIYYTTDGSTPNKNSKLYTRKIKIKKTTTVKAIAIKGSDKSKVITRKYRIVKK